MISIVIPVYQTEAYIEKCIKSLCRQTDKNFEIILVDDGSKDNSISIATKLLDNFDILYSLVSYKDNKGTVMNRGLACARNLGIDCAKGNWILCIDSDDYIHSDTIKVLNYYIGSSDSDVILFDYVMVSEKSDEVNYDKVNSPQSIHIKTMNKKEIVDCFFKRDLKVVIPTVLIKKSFLKDHNISYPDNSRYSEDQIYLWKLFLNSDNVLYIDKVLYFYVQRESSIMYSSTLAQIVSGYNSGIDSLEKYRNTVITNNLMINLDITYDMIIARWILGLAHSSVRLLSYPDFKQFMYSVNYRTVINKLNKCNDSKTVLSARLLLFSKKIYYTVCRYYFNKDKT